MSTPNYDLPWVNPPFSFDYTVAFPSSLLGWVWNDWWVAIQAVPILGVVIAFLQIGIPFWLNVFATLGIMGEMDSDGMVSDIMFYQGIYDSYFPIGLQVFFNPFTWEGWFWMAVDMWATAVSFAGPLYIVKWIVFLVMYLMGTFTLTEGFEERFNWNDPLKAILA